LAEMSALLPHKLYNCNLSCLFLVFEPYIKLSEISILPLKFMNLNLSDYLVAVLWEDRHGNACHPMYSYNTQLTGRTIILQKKD
jgi:hypothetical protein